MNKKTASKADWLKAFRLRTLPLSISGILVGSALAHRAHAFDILLFVLGIGTVLFLQILSNLANDLGDNLKGTDNEQRIGPKRSTQTGAISVQSMKNAIYLFAICSLLFGGILAFLGTRDMGFEIQITFYILSLACIAAAVGYTMGKKAYGYLGLGDLFVFSFFGLLSVCGIYVLMTKHFDWTILLPASSIGFMSAAVLNLNNMRDHENDAKSGKNTFVVKIGFHAALKYHLILLFTPLLLISIFAYLTNNYWSMLVIFTYLIIGKSAQYTLSNPYPEKLDSQLGKVAISTFLFALLFSLSCLIS